MDPNKESAGSLIENSSNNRFVIQATEAVHFKLIRSQSDIDDDSIVFGPEFVHQHFGENETIFGYSNLRINIYYSADQLQMYVGIEYEDKIDQEHKDIEPDNILKCLNDNMPDGFKFETNLNNFSRTIENETNFVPEGSLIHAYSNTTKDGKSKNFEMYFVEEPSDQFKAYFTRMQTFAFWYIDAAQYADTDDPKWCYYVLYEKCNLSGQSRYYFAGYSSVYDYYAYPDHIRPRIAQILLLPPFQKSGHGSHMLQSIYNNLMPNPKVLDITAEDPADSFINLRDYLDSINCSKLQYFQPEQLVQGFSKETADEARTKLKIPKKQARRVYEILRLKHTNCADPIEFRKYRLDVKRRLNIPFQKSQRDWGKLMRALDGEELAQAAAVLNPAQRMQQLQNLFEQTVDDYRNTLNRIATHSDVGSLVGLSNGVNH